MDVGLSDNNSGLAPTQRSEDYGLTSSTEVNAALNWALLFGRKSYLGFDLPFLTYVCKPAGTPWYCPKKGSGAAGLQT